MERAPAPIQRAWQNAEAFGLGISAAQ